MATKSTKKKELNQLPSKSELTSSLPAELVVTPENQEAIIATCDKIGATREHCIKTLFEGTTATKITLDKYGEEHEEPNTPERIKSALSLLEIRGDFKNKDAVKATTYNTVVYQWKK